MDAERQIRLNFLEEAEEYFDNMESNALGLANTTIDPQKIDIVLRAAHSIKGGAAMMGFETLSRVAHRLEDFLKILRVRYSSSEVSIEVETLLLLGIDCLRQIGDLHRQGSEVVDADISDRTQPIFEQLQHHLGDLQEADENALMAQDEAIDPALLLFEEGVETTLDEFEDQLKTLAGPELAQALGTTAQGLIAFGLMANLDPFVQLCQSIQEKAETQSPLEIKSLADQSLQTWRRSHALVLRGRIEKLPSCLAGQPAIELEPEPNATDSLAPHRLETAEFEGVEAGLDPFGDEGVNLQELQSAFGSPESQELPETTLDPLPLESEDFSALQSAFTFINDPSELESEPQAASEIPLESEDFSALQSAFTFINDPSELESESQAASEISLESENFSALQSAFTFINDASELEPEPQATSQALKIKTSAPEPSDRPAADPKVEKMVRVPASQLKQFNTLFEQLVLNRNNIHLRLRQYQNIVSLMGQRVAQIEESNTQLRNWYDRASLDGFLSNNGSLSSSIVSRAGKTRDQFDSLEMDRYSDIHLICQGQIESIVQLQEVAADITLGLEDINQAANELNYTTQSMQGNVTRTQMLPFAEAVKRCPRLIRDLNLQFQKQVDLRIVGENTLLDRAVIESLNAPLMHLLRNAFDHGIEDSETRLALGKPASGTITIKASNQGTFTVVTLSDDGGGISLDKIRARVVQMGVPEAEVAQISESRTFGIYL